jgi:sugar O-acyltransferase (sialic acid O-acetyltransferase NeuD family)
MLLYGASGHAKVIIDCLLSQQELIMGIFDDDKSKKHLMGIEIQHYYSEIYHPEEEIIIAIGDNKIRQSLATTVEHSFGRVAHTSAMVSEHAVYGDGTVIFQNAVLQSGASLGEHVIINTSATVDHDCHVGDFVHIAPNATLCGGVTIGEGTLIGAGSIVIPNVKIGKWVTIGAGSVITKNIPDNAIVVGNPSRIVRFNK